MSLFKKIDLVMQHPLVLRWIGPVLVIYSVFTLWAIVSEQDRSIRDAKTIQSLKTQLKDLSRERKSLHLQLATKCFENRVSQYRQARAEALEGPTK